MYDYKLVYHVIDGVPTNLKSLTKLFIYSTLCKVFQKEHNNQLAQIISLVQQITQILKASSYVGTTFFIRTISQVNGGLNSSKNKNNLTKNWGLSQEIIPSMIFSQNIGNDHGHGVT